MPDKRSAEHEAARKRHGRQVTNELYERLQQLVDSENQLLLRHHVPEHVGKKTREDTLQRLISLVKIYARMDTQQPGASSSLRLHRSGIDLSMSFGTVMVRTKDLQVLESNNALQNFWMFSPDGRGSGLTGQSLWSVVHWDDHDEIEKLQGMFVSRDASVVGQTLQVRLLRMTNVGGGLAKFVCRRLKVFHVSSDGATALLEVSIMPEDTRALEIDEEGQMGASFHMPQFNLRCGDFTLRDPDTAHMTPTEYDSAWLGWLLPGDDQHSHDFPWRFKEAADQLYFPNASGCNFLISWFVNSNPGVTVPGVSCGLFHPSQRRLEFINRAISIFSCEEGRPVHTKGGEHVLLSSWSGMTHEESEIAELFKCYEGCKLFLDSGEAIYHTMLESAKAGMD